MKSQIGITVPRFSLFLNPFKWSNIFILPFTNRSFTPSWWWWVYAIPLAVYRSRLPYLEKFRPLWQWCSGSVFLWREQCGGWNRTWRHQNKVNTYLFSNNKGNVFYLLIKGTNFGCLKIKENIPFKNDIYGDHRSPRCSAIWFFYLGV